MQLLKRLTQSVSKINEQTRGKILEGKFKSALNWQKKLSALANARGFGTKPIIPVQSVENFRRYVRENPVAKMYFQGGLDQIPKIVYEYYTDEQGVVAARPREGINSGADWEHVLNQFAIVTKTPPAFSDLDIIGVPFYALVIDLLNTDYGRTFFALDEVNKLLKPIYDDYGAMLDSPYSLMHMNDKENGWLSPKALERVDYKDFICDTSAPHYGFTSWHDWFDREIKPDARPFDPKATNVIVNNSEYYPNFKMPYLNAQWHDRFWLKDQNYSLAEMFGADALPQTEQQYFKDHFIGGTVYQGFLNPWCYHRWRAPVSGIIEKCYKIGNSYYAGNPSLSYHLAESYIASQPLLTMTSVRQIYIINCDNPAIGRVAVIEIGMAEVSGIVNKVQEGQRINKGDLLGMFRFGGSSHAFIFDNKASPYLEFNQSIYDRKLNPDTGVYESVLQKVRSPLCELVLPAKKK